MVVYEYSALLSNYLISLTSVGVISAKINANSYAMPFTVIDYLGCVVMRIGFASVKLKNGLHFPAGFAAHRLGSSHSGCSSLDLLYALGFSSLISEELDVMAESAACPAFRLGSPQYEQVDAVSPP